MFATWVYTICVVLSIAKLEGARLHQRKNTHASNLEVGAVPVGSLEAPSVLPRAGAAPVHIMPPNNGVTPMWLSGHPNDLHRVVVTAPEWCQPCMGESMQMSYLNLTSWIITPQKNLVAGDDFLADLPVPDATVEAQFVSAVPITGRSLVGRTVTLSVKVPKYKFPGQGVNVKMPEGDIRRKLIPGNSYYPRSFTFEYHPEQELKEKTWTDISKEHSCCCEDTGVGGGECLWFANDMFGKHSCPRMVKWKGYSPCATTKTSMKYKSCWLSGKCEVTKTRDGLWCEASYDGQAFFSSKDLC